MKAASYASALLLLTATASAALPGDATEGKRLHDSHCTGCHNTSIYTRKDHVVQSLDALREQLEGCSHMANQKLSATQMQSLVKYLNEQFYRFP
jgi:hypothetical protein